MARGRMTRGRMTRGRGGRGAWWCYDAALEASGLGKVTRALSAIDFGSGQERGLRGEQREKYFASKQDADADADAQQDLAAATSSKAPEK